MDLVGRSRRAELTLLLHFSQAIIWICEDGGEYFGQFHIREDRTGWGEDKVWTPKGCGKTKMPPSGHRDGITLSSRMRRKGDRYFF